MIGEGRLFKVALALNLAARTSRLGLANWVLVRVAAGFGIASTAIRVPRWRLVLRPVARVPILDLWLISVASSLVNFVIPIRSGEVAKSLFLKQRHNVSIAASLPTVADDRSFDVLLGANQSGPWFAYVLGKILRKQYVVYLAQPLRLLYPRQIDEEKGIRIREGDHRFLLFLKRTAGVLINWADGISVASAHEVLMNGNNIG